MWPRQPRPQTAEMMHSAASNKPPPSFKKSDCFPWGKPGRTKPIPHDAKVTYRGHPPAISYWIWLAELSWTACMTSYICRPTSKASPNLTNNPFLRHQTPANTSQTNPRTTAQATSLTCTIPPWKSSSAHPRLCNLCPITRRVTGPRNACWVPSAPAHRLHSPAPAAAARRTPSAWLPAGAVEPAGSRLGRPRAHSCW